jgi:hypothetical protein
MQLSAIKKIIIIEHIKVVLRKADCEDKETEGTSSRLCSMMALAIKALSVWVLPS